MKKILTALVGAFGGMLLSAENADSTVCGNPLADPKAVVVCGNARFTVLTDRLIRMEYAPDGRFEDRASLTFVNRALPVPAFTSRTEGNGCVIETMGLTLTYAGGAFTRDSLRIASCAKPPAAGAFDWRFGDKDDGTGADYATRFATRRIGWQAGTDGKSLELAIHPREGKFPGMKPRTTWTIRLPGTFAPTSVTRNGQKLPFDRPLAEMAQATSGKKGLFARLKGLSQEYKLAYGDMVHPWAMQPDEFLRVAQTASAVTEAPADAPALLARFDRELKTFVPTLVAKRKLSIAFATRLSGQLGLAAPEALPEEKFTHELDEKLSVSSSSETAKYAVRRVDDRHLLLTCGEPASATVKMPLFSGYVRCYPRVNGRRTGDLVLTKGVGDRPTFTLIMLAPCYGATEYEIETCVPYRPE